MKNKLLTILLSAAIAFGLWLYVITVEQPESQKTYYDIPVVLQNENILAERGLMIISERPTVTLQLSGTRTNLNQLNESNINVIANMNSIVSAGTHELNYTVSYPGNVPSGAIARQHSEPDMITLKVENKITKPVPVIPVYSGSIPEGLIADKENVVLDYTTIEVSGPESVMNQITQAVIAVNLQDRTQTFAEEYTYTLCNDAGEPVDSQWVTTNVAAVNLTLDIQRVKEVKLKVNVIAGGGATEQSSTIKIEPATILISGSEALLENLNEVELGTINLSEIESDKILPMTIILPSGITNETGITEATVEVKFPNLRTVSINVDNIQLINVPDGLEAILDTQVLTIKLRGSASQIEGITSEDVTVTVDLKDATEGRDKYMVQITVSDEFAGVGALNSYTVMVSLNVPEAGG